MTVLGKDKIHYIEKILLYTPLVVGTFLALSVWGGQLTLGFIGVGFILLGVLIDNVKKVAGNHSHFIPSTYSILFIAIIVYLWAMGSIYEGIFYALIGMNLIFDRHLKGQSSFCLSAQCSYSSESELQPSHPKLSLTAPSLFPQIRLPDSHIVEKFR